MGKREMNTTVRERKNDIDNLSWVEKIELLHSLNKRFDEKAEKLELLSIEFSEKVQELKEACRELKKKLSE